VLSVAVVELLAFENGTIMADRLPASTSRLMVNMNSLRICDNLKLLQITADTEKDMENRGREKRNDPHKLGGKILTAKGTYLHVIASNEPSCVKIGKTGAN
jgi:hypothetical protein